ncbi:MAG TPA: AAA family ATPase, partial [Solirubrobacteraceae bacterium]
MDGLAIVVFSDLVDSTTLLARLGDDRMERLRRRHMDDVTEVVRAAGGRVIKTLGDGAMASFASALGALRAAAQIQVSVERLDEAHTEIGIAARVGVAAGEPIAHEEDLHGMAVVIASRLCSAAGSGEVLVQELVQGLVASRAGLAFEPTRSYELKGVPTQVRALRLRWRELCPAPETATPRDLPPPTRRALPLPQMLAAYAVQPLIGRDREIGVLRDATVPRKPAQAVLVLGEPGIGKTRHAAAAAAEAHANGATVVLARCPPEPAIAFEPWVRAIGEVARAGDDAWREALAGVAGIELSTLVPELSRHAAAGSETRADEIVAAEGARYRLLHGIGAALAHAAGQAPLHVVLDDAHWCDAASAQALGHLLENAPSGGLVLVATAREREMGRGHPLSRVLAGLRRTGDLRELQLQGLDAGGTAALVAARLGRAITPRLAARLQARTAGNPFFAAELACDLEEQGALREEEALSAAPAPDAVTDLVEERLARLDPVTEQLLAAVAAIGPSAPVALAARAAGIDERNAERAVAQALSERLVDEVAAAQPTIAFPHALIREALTAGATGASRARLHLAIARALEETPDSEPAELARHYGGAVAIAGPERAIGAYARAAAAAAEGHDHEQAAAQLRRALALIDAHDLSARAPLLLELGEQELLAADLPRAREAFRAAGNAARGSGDAVMLARAALGFAGGDIGFGWETATDDDATVVLLREGLQALSEREPRLALRMTFRLAYVLIYTDDDEVLVALTRRAAELHERVGDDESQVLFTGTSWLRTFARHPDPLGVLDRLEDPIETLRIAERCGREDVLFRIVQWSAVIYYALGRIADCERAVARGGEIAARLGSPRFSWEVDVARGQRLLDRGDRAGGEALVRRGGATLRRLRPDIQVAIEVVGLLQNAWLFDGDTMLERAGYEAMEVVAPYGLMYAITTCAAAMDGDREYTHRRLAELLQGDFERLRRPDMHMPTTVCILALAATLAGDRAAGERLRPLLERQRSHVLQAAPAICSGHLPEWHFGRLDLLVGRPEAAVAELEGAVARADALGLVWLAALARVDLAIALHRSGDAGDGERARELLAAGRAIAERHGMRWTLDMADLAEAELEGRERPVAEGTVQPK